MRFHAEAARRYDEEARAFLQEVQGFGPVLSANRPRPSELHVSHTFTKDQVISMQRFRLEVNQLGEPCGMLWVSQGHQVGWNGRAFGRIRSLAHRMVRKEPISGLVSEQFGLDTMCTWLIESLESQRSDTLSEYFAAKCQDSVRDHEIWFPLFRTYALAEFSIGQVAFRTISKAMVNAWRDRIPLTLPNHAEIVATIDWKRAEWQGSLAACVRIRAEERRAVQLGRDAAKNATALLSFLSPANRNSKLTNFATLLGFERMGCMAALFIENNAISTYQESLSDPQGADWHIQLAAAPGQTRVLSALHDLASNQTTELRRSLYDALIIYSRQAHATELSDKLIFALAGLESLFLRDANEPIQKTLGERIAFLIGATLQERKGIVRNVAAIYKVRSAFVHHGQEPNDQQELDQFLQTAWQTFATLLEGRDLHLTRAALVSALEDLRMS
jgi:hypothetical protein